MVTFLLGLLGFGLLAAAWYIFEDCWGRGLFGQRSASDFVINVRAGKAVMLLDETDLLPVDVRPRRDFLAGHLPGAVNAPFVGTTLDASALVAIDRDQPVLVYCDGGYRSRRALPALRETGFTAIYHLHRGFLSWKMRKAPTESGPAT